ncbi:hypothetical protein MtrunA17_Chr2g0312141 [Medicago truncatula]|uniref:Transmembrane protein n=1 Tax=Medicago truncatula TaxID=3880 RepID=A0A396J8Z9_MEDTR|nr:hypothetical protein MtrunA17_Chr2g0312141 [Medicago truncatula]
MYSLTCENIQFIFLLFLYEFGMLLLWFLLRFIPLCRMIELLKECTCCSSRMEFHFDSNGLGCLAEDGGFPGCQHSWDVGIYLQLQKNNLGVVFILGFFQTSQINTSFPSISPRSKSHKLILNY